MMKKVVSLLTSVGLLMGSLSMMSLAADEVIPDGYTDEPTQNVQLGAGQYYKELTGFENGKGIDQAHVTATGNLQVNYSKDAANSGTASAKWTISVGGGNDIKITRLLPDDQAGNDWSDADYVQFYVKNTAETAFQLNHIDYEIGTTSGNAKSIKAGAAVDFYDMAAEEWTTLTTFTSTTSKYVCIEIPGGAEGLVRIPLDADTFEGFNADEMSAIYSFRLWVGAPGCIPDSVLYVDDLGLIHQGEIPEPEPEPEPGTDFPFEENPSVNVGLQDGQTYKELNGFETETGVTYGCSENAGTGAFSGQNAKNGEKSYQLTFNNGSANAIAFPKFSPAAAENMDWTGANAVQLYIDNPTSTVLYAEDIKLITEDGSYKMTRNAVVYFADMATNSWTQLNVVEGGNAAYYGVMIPAGTKGFLRIPLNEENFENFSEIALTKVSQMEIFFQMPGCLKGSAVYLDDFGLIGGAETELVQIDDYLETDTVVLNEGERFKLLSGFEDDDAAKLAADKVIAGSVEVAAEGANNGDKALMLTFTDGTAQGFRNFSVDTSAFSTSNWTRAKYLQFYVNNTCAAGSNDLQLFYLQVNNGNKMVGKQATGLKLYDLSTGQWSDLEVTDNSDHVLENGDKVPTICIPAGFEGYVRIPLTNENFDNCTLSEELPNVTRIMMYALVKGVVSGSKVYFDDFGLVTYDGDTPPSYEDGEAPDPDDEYTDVETAFDLSGTIVGLDGKPLASATVTLNGSSKFVTNAQGQFRFDGLTTGLHELAVVGADGTDYSYITIEVLTGAATSFEGTNVRIAHDADGLNIGLKIGDFGPEITSADNNLLQPESGTPVTPDEDTPKEDGIPALGVGSSILAVLLFLAGAAGCVWRFGRKQFVK